MKKPGLNFNPGLVLIRLQTTKPWALKTGRQFVSRPKKKNKNIADEPKLKLLDLSLDKLTNEVIFKNEKVQLRQSWFHMTVTFFCVKWCFVCLFVCLCRVWGTLMWYSVHFTMSGTLVTTYNSKSECGFQTECLAYNSTMDKKNQI